VTLGLSQEQLAERAGLHWTFLSGVERGVRNPGLNTIGCLARALGVELDTLLRDEPAQLTLQMGTSRRRVDRPKKMPSSNWNAPRIVHAGIRGNRIKARLDELQITQEQGAKLAGMSYRHFNRIVHAESEPSLLTAVRLRTLLSAPIDALWDFDVEAHLPQRNPADSDDVAQGLSDLSVVRNDDIGVKTAQ
jgi:transcriptional regulator with XRE-family HTH domain